MVAKYIIISFVISAVVSLILTKVMANYYFLVISEHIDKTIMLIKEELLAKEDKL